MKRLIIISFALTLLSSYGQNNCQVDFMFQEFEQEKDSILRLGGSIDLHPTIGHISESKEKLELRFYDEGRKPGSLQKMFQITCLNGEFTAKKYEYLQSHHSNNDSVSTADQIKITNEKMVICRIPIRAFVDSLERLHFFSLDDMNKEKYIKTDTIISEGERRIETSTPLIFDGANYSFQYKIDKMFRSYFYENPYAYSCLFPTDTDLIYVNRIIRLFFDYME